MRNRCKLQLIVALSIIISPISEVLAITIDSPIIRTVTIQPIVVSDDDGSNTATFLGSLSQQTAIEDFIDVTWSQAGIDVNFLEANAWNNSFANQGNSQPRSGLDLDMIVGLADEAGVTHANTDFINMFFVNIPAGFDILNENHAAGFAFVGGNGITQFVGSGLLDSNQNIIADVVAHEIGHNLGLFHTEDGINNLMSPDGTSTELTGDQIVAVLNNDFAIDSGVAPVPIPAAVWLFGSGLIGLVSFSRKKR
jgi:hypothetical protein